MRVLVTGHALALGEPGGRVPDLGGPRVESMDLLRTYRETVQPVRALVARGIAGKAELSIDR